MEAMDGERVQKLFDHLEAQKAILSSCTDLYKTLSSHFSSLDQSLSQQYRTLDSKIQSLQSDSHETLSFLDQCERSIPDRRASLSAEVEARKQAALSEFDNPAPQENVELVEALMSLCRRMDAQGLLQFVVTKRKEPPPLKGEIGSALRECVDPQRLVLDVVEVFIRLKVEARKSSAAGGGLTDRRWACGMVVSGLFPPDELKEAGKKKKMERSMPAFAGRIVKKAKNVIEAWKERVEGNGGVLNGVGPAEAAMILQLVIGFGLKEEFDQEFLKKLVVEFAAVRRDIPKLAVPIFEEKIGDIIGELVNYGKEIEAIYFASEAGLIETFQPVSLLRNYLTHSEKKAADIMKKGNNSSASRDESINSEMNSIKAIIKCVEDLVLEEQFSLDELKERLAALEKTKADKKKKSVTASKPSNKRAHGASGSRTSNQPASKPTKAAKISNSYPSFARRNPVPLPNHSPVTRYPPAAYNYPPQAAYDTTPPAASHSSVYGGSLASSSSVLAQKHHSLPADSAGAGIASLLGTGGIYGDQASYNSSLLGTSGVYGAQASYNSYNLGTATAPAYQPPSFQHSYTK